MDRRDFLKRAAAVSGAVIVGSKSADVFGEAFDLQGKDSQLWRTLGDVFLPNVVEVETDDEVFTMKYDQGVFSSGDIVVKYRQKHNVVYTSINSETKNVKYVRMIWNQPLQPTVRILGDHWERGYGDLQWQGPDTRRIMPWYFVEYDGSRCHAMGVKTGCKAFCHWKRDTETMTLVLDVRNGTHGVRLGKRTLKMAELISMDGRTGESPFDFMKRFCKMLCDSPRLPKKPIYGINDWYFAYGDNSDKLILQTVDMMQDMIPDVGNLPFCVIDAGWACYAPGSNSAASWSDNFYTPNNKFPDMHRLASQIKAKRMRPGLWMRPLCAAHDTRESLRMMNKNGNGRSNILDPTIDENLAYLTKCFKAYRNWGYEMVKHDYSTCDIFGKWGFSMLSDGDMTYGNWSFNDRSVTNAEVVLRLYTHLRKAAGKIMLIGCNTVSHLSAGLFEIQRTGDDTSGREWSRTLKMGVNTIAFRMPQHNNFYVSDPDCVGLTKDVAWRLNKQWMELIANSGTALFISAQPEALGAEQRATIKQCFQIAATNAITGEPLDWMTNITPSKWKLRGAYREFDWKE